MVFVWDRHVEQWSRAENPEIGSHKYVQLIFDKSAWTIQLRKDSHLYQWCWSNLDIHRHKVNPDLNLTPHTKSSPKWIMDLKYKTSKAFRKKIRYNLWDLGLGKAFDLRQKAQWIKKTSDNLVFLKLENFCSAKDPGKRMKTRVTGWKKIFINYIYNKGYYWEYIKNPQNLTNSPVENRQKKWRVTEEYTQMTSTWKDI